MNEPQPPFEVLDLDLVKLGTTNDPINCRLPQVPQSSIRFLDAKNRLWRVEGERELKIDDYILVGDEYTFGADWRNAQSLIGYRIDERHGFNYRRPAHLVEIEQPKPEKEVKTCATTNANAAEISIAPTTEGKSLMDAQSMVHVPTVASNEGERSNPVRPSELLPCPFCGNTKVEICNAADEDEQGDPKQFFVVCSVYENGCGGSSGYHEPKDKAVNNWNTRK